MQILVQTGTEVGEAHFALSNLFRHQSQYEKSLHHIELALEISPQNPEYRLQKLILSADLNGEDVSYEKASQLLLEVTDKLVAEPENVLVRTYLGCLQIEVGKSREAVTQLQSVFMVNPAQPGLYGCMGKGYLRSGDLEKATRYLEAGYQLNKLDDQIAQLLGETYLRAGEPQKADQLFTQALAINERNLEALAGKAQIAFSNGQIEIAWEHIDRALSIHGKFRGMDRLKSLLSTRR